MKKSSWFSNLVHRKGKKSFDLQSDTSGPVFKKSQTHLDLSKGISAPTLISYSLEDDDSDYEGTNPPLESFRRPSGQTYSQITPKEVSRQNSAEQDAWSPRSSTHLAEASGVSGRNITIDEETERTFHEVVRKNSELMMEVERLKTKRAQVVPETTNAQNTEEKKEEENREWLKEQFRLVAEEAALLAGKPKSSDTKQQPPQTPKDVKSNDVFIDQMRRLLDEEIEENDDLDELLMSSLYAPKQVEQEKDKPPDNSSFETNFEQKRETNIQNPLEPHEVKNQERKTSSDSMGSDSSSERKVVAAPAASSLKSLSAVKKVLPPVKSLIRPAPVLTFTFDDDEDPFGSQTYQVFSPRLEQDPFPTREPLAPDITEKEEDEAEIIETFRKKSIENAVEESVFRESVVKEPVENSSVRDLILMLEKERAEKRELENTLKSREGLEDNRVLLEDYQKVFKSSLELEEKIFKLQSEAAKNSYTMDVLTSNLEREKREVASLTQIKNRLTEELESLKEEKQNLFMQNVECNRIIDSLKEQIKNNKVVPGAKSVKDDKHYEKLQELMERNRELISQNDHLRDQLSETEKSVRRYLKLESDIEKLKEENRFLSSQLLSATDNLRKSQNEHRQKEEVVDTHPHSDLINSMRELNGVILRLEDKTSKLDQTLTTRQESLIKAAVVENSQKEINNRIESVFEETRDVLKDMTQQVSSFKNLIQSQSQNSSQNNNPNNNGNTPQNMIHDDKKLPVVFEKKLSELRTSIERLEDNIQNQEMRILLDSRIQAEMDAATSHILDQGSLNIQNRSSRSLFYSSFLSDIPTDHNPRSHFVRALFQLNQSKSHRNLNDLNFTLNNSKVQNQVSNPSKSMSNFYFAKNNLDREISRLKCDLGLYSSAFNPEINDL